MWQVLKFIVGLLIAIATIIFTFFIVVAALGVAAISIIGVLIFVVILLFTIPLVILFVKLTGKGSVTCSVGKKAYTYGTSERDEVIDVEVEECKIDIK
ncbi:MAG TPA: hypothetical protein DCY20_08335 [Firmicutes bacterium]|nr:hypothetical protein [Bacillota bacterium]